MKQGWEIKKLGDVATILDSQRKPVTKKDRCNGIYPYYGASGVQDYVDKYIFDGRYLLVGEDGAKWGASDKSAYIVDGKCWVNNHAHILKLDNSINDKMVEYYLVYKDLSEYITGAIVPKLTQQALKQIPIPVPERAEQERIVGELDCLSGIIAAKRAQLRELDTLAQSIFYTMFGDPITNDKGWQTKTLGESFGYIKNGANIKQERGANGIPITRIETLSGGVFNRDRLGYANIYSIDKYKSHILDSGDLLLSHINSKTYIGRTVLYKKKNDEVIIHGMNLLRLKVNINILQPVYSCYYFMTDFFKIQIASYRKDAVNQSSISVNDLKKINIRIPPIALQNEFAEKIEQIEKQKQLIKASIAETEDLFNSRMSCYFD